MFGAVDGGSVVGVPEVEVWVYGLVASPAEDCFAGCDALCPLGAFTVVGGVVAAFCSCAARLVACSGAVGAKSAVGVAVNDGWAAWGSADFAAHGYSLVQAGMNGAMT